MDKQNTRAVGNEGEERACEYLVKNGHNILCRNYTCKGGEVDIISSQGEYLVFTEVKRRSGASKMRSAAFSVDKIKAKRLCHTVRSFVDEYRENPLVSSLKPRIDILEVYTDNSIIHSETSLLELY